MKRRTIESLRRCDRAFAGAVVIAIATIVGAACANPYTDSFGRAEMQPVVVVRVAAKDEKGLEASANRTAILAADEQLAADKRCLAEAMYYEARGEGTRGQMAIAEVIFDRIRSGAYPNSVCGVVFEGAQERHACQFSFVCNGEMERPKNPHAWAKARGLAARIMTGSMRLGDLTGGATNYHAVNVDPEWAATLQRTVQIGNHVFYRRAPRARGI